MKRRMKTVFQQPRPELGAVFNTLCPERAAEWREDGFTVRTVRMAFHGAPLVTIAGPADLSGCGSPFHNCDTPWLWWSDLA